MWLTIIVLLLAGLSLMFLELFVPGGILGTIGVVLMLVGVWFSYSSYGAFYGIAVLFGCSVVTVILISVLLKRFPDTFIGKRMILSNSASRMEGYLAESNTAEGLVGKEGVAESDLRPAGIALIDGERYDVVTEGEFIDTQQRIRVIRVDGNRIVVAI